MPQKKNRPKIEHYIIEIFGLDSKILLHAQSIKKYVDRLIKLLDLKILSRLVYNFKPYGATYLFEVREKVS